MGQRLCDVTMSKQIKRQPKTAQLRFQVGLLMILVGVSPTANKKEQYHDYKNWIAAMFDNLFKIEIILRRLNSKAGDHKKHKLA